MYRLIVFDLDGTLADLSCWPYSHAEMYPDMRRAVEGLRSDGYVLSAATMMDEAAADRILREWGVRDLFTCVKGRSGVGGKGPLIRECIEEAGCSPSETLMVGDSPGDRIGA
jgi:phosphoglycolate phosphatase-like HAD superfamily hydrolase